MIIVIDIWIFDTTVLSSDEPDGQEERQLQYLDQEKLSYITNYLEQTRDTDVHSVSTEDDSGKPGSNSAPSEFGFEETSGKTQSIPRVPNPSPFSICQLPQSQGGWHWFVIKGLPRDIRSGSVRGLFKREKRRRRGKTELMLEERVRNLENDTLRTRIRP